MADKFKATMYVTVFTLARDGLSDEQIGKALGVAGNTFRAWVAKRPALRDAVNRGRGEHSPGNEMTFQEYVYNHLSPNLRGLWDKINACEELENGIARVEQLLAGQGTRTRQHLFLYSLTQSLFNVSKSLRKLGIPRKMYENWRQNDPEFTELMDEIHWHKKNFFEQAFIGRIVAGDTAAIIHAVKTKCRDRGYNDKVEVVHSGTIHNTHTICVTALKLDAETRKKILAALRLKMAEDEAVAQRKLVE